MEIMKNYILLSLELHLFFSRIMKEHSLFLEVGFLPQNPEFIDEADQYRKEFEELLYHVVCISDGIISDEVLNSGEIVTEFTFGAERKTEEFTGIPIESRITLMEQKLSGGGRFCPYPEMNQMVCEINQRAIQLLEGLICFKEKILSEVLACNMFTANYPLLIKHIIREAKLYLSYVLELEKFGTINPENRRKVEQFWNQIMMEHAMFIRGLLDPSEAELIDTADGFAKDYARLLEEAKYMNDRTMGYQTDKTLEETLKYRDFKAAGTKGITNCEIQSIILPLLADHVLREANHYVRILTD